MRPSQACVALTALLLFATARDAKANCIKKGSERWLVKTSAPVHVASPAKRFTVQDFAKLPAPVHMGDAGQPMLATRYDYAMSSGLHEGDLIAVRGYVKLIKTSPDDCDYHIQINPTNTGTGGTVVVEIPKADALHVVDGQLRKLLLVEHDSILKQLKLTKEPGTNRIKGPAYVEFIGALFYDGPHHKNCAGRGVDSPAVTCWEVHPVTLTHFVARP